MLETSKVNTYQNKWLAFIGIALLSFGAYLDYTVVNVALPTIQLELHANLVSMQWVMNIYFLALCVSATVMGRFGDLYGRRRCLYIGAGIFVIASLVAGLSFNIGWLILGRLFQGIGAAIIFPLGLSLLPHVFPEGERGKAVAWFGSIGGIALALGPLLGGLIVTYCGWRWIFFLNVPICLLGYLLCFKSVRESHVDNQHVSLDIKGMLLLALTMCGVVLSLIYSQNLGWTNPLTLTCLAVGVITSILLVRAERNHQNPLINFSDYANLLFFAGAALCFLAGVLSAVTLFFDPLYLQIIKDQSPQLSGFVLFAIPVSVFLSAFLVGWLINRLGVLHTIVLGLALACFAALLQVFFTSNTSLIYIVSAFVCLGSMWALGNTVSIIAAQTAVGPERASVATGTLVTMFNIGGSIGITIAVVIYNFVTANSLATISATQSALSSAQLSYLKDFVSNPAHSLALSTHDLVHHLFNKIFIHGFIGVMSFLFIISFIALLIVLRYKVIENRGKVSIPGNARANGSAA
ncbi:multidrug efflux system protein [Legionella lansingensis]|uniref:MFS transporter DHA2 family multidrug resistance protein B n=1 Tax=Legionella lansingensis TaxID=45067 RepID=A0A0W0VMN5_9GAMM|nr:MFS transporter [Legionella lansingensis]KTD21419.1 MFS transporter DHA2 family multidrug resistance protein B [Legionella lansingensis]SNV51961.1 multidrug efflux system protein [Legionella lansingensis]